MKAIQHTVEKIASKQRRRVPTAWELQARYPRLIPHIEANAANPGQSIVWVVVPQAQSRIIRSVPDARWSRQRLAWLIPASAALQLETALLRITGGRE